MGLLPLDPEPRVLIRAHSLSLSSIQLEDKRSAVSATIFLSKGFICAKMIARLMHSQESGLGRDIEIWSIITGG